MSRWLFRVLVVAGIAAMSACAPAHPMTPLRPLYPAILVSAGFAGDVALDARISRTGEAELHVTADSAMGMSLLVQSVRGAAAAAEWRPARRWGFARRDCVHYLFRFVPIADTATARKSASAGPRALDCPTPRSRSEVVICARQVYGPLKRIETRNPDSADGGTQEPPVDD